MSLVLNNWALEAKKETVEFANSVDTDESHLDLHYFPSCLSILSIV